VTTPAAPIVATAWPDSPMWHQHAAAGHWTPPPDCPHAASPVFGPCACRDQDHG
jgi:hypothetical protein